MRLFLLVGAFMVACSAGCLAEPIRKWTVGSWEVSQHQKHCIASSPALRSGSTMLMFAMHSGDELFALIGNAKWRMREKRVREVLVTIDQDYLGAFPTVAMGHEALAVKLPLQLMKELQDGAFISLRFDRAQLIFPLKHTRHGLDTLVKCFLGTARATGTANGPTRAGDEGPSSGSGMFVSYEGHVLTNEHVVRACSSPQVTDVKGRRRRGEVIAKDAANDLALIRTDFEPDAVAPLGGSVRQGEWVASFGFPLTQLLSTTGTFSEGSVAATAGLRDNSSQLQITAPIQPGNSGGPLFDKYGNVVGVVNAQLSSQRMAAVGITPQNVNFAIKVTVAKSFLESRQIETVEGAGTTALPPEDVADRAREVSVLILCDGR